MKESEFWKAIADGIELCTHCPAKDDCSGVTVTECINALRRAHAKTQPPWVKLLLQTGHCPPDEQAKCNKSINIDCEPYSCWLAYLKEQYGYEPVEGL